MPLKASRMISETLFDVVFLMRVKCDSSSSLIRRETTFSGRDGRGGALLLSSLRGRNAAIVGHKIPPGYYFQYFALIVFSSSLLMSLQRLTSQLPTQALKMARLVFLSVSFQGIPHHFIPGLAIIEGFHEGDNGILLGIGKSQVPHFFGIHVHGRLGQGPASDPFTGITVVADRQDIAGIVKMNDLLQTPEITVMAVDLYKVGEERLSTLRRVGTLCAPNWPLDLA